MENYTFIIQLLLAAFFLMPGLTKVKTPKAELVAQGKMPPNGSIKFIRFLGVAELLGVVAMVIPLFVKELQTLTALAAIGFAIVMAGALVIHLKKKEFIKIPILVVALGASVFVSALNF